jgi:hypothetical protein
MLRGEFIRADGLVTPNNVTTFGAATILELALQDGAYSFYVGLCDGVYADDLQIEDLTEPTIGTNGYARIAVARSAVGWPTEGTLNGETYFETDWLTWAAVGGDFNQETARMMIVGHATQTTGNVFALSAALPAAYAITPLTDLSDRQLKYRLYLR